MEYNVTELWIGLLRLCNLHIINLLQCLIYYFFFVVSYLFLIYLRQCRLCLQLKITIIILSNMIYDIFTILQSRLCGGYPHERKPSTAIGKQFRHNDKILKDNHWWRARRMTLSDLRQTEDVLHSKQPGSSHSAETIANACTKGKTKSLRNIICIDIVSTWTNRTKVMLCALIIVFTGG